MTTLQDTDIPAALLDMPAARVARRIARGRLDDVTSARAALALAEPDALHDFRVALRRLRSWLRAYRPWIGDSLRKRTRRGLREIADATSAARDAEVAAAALAAGRSDAMAAELRDDAARARRRLLRVLRRTFERSQRRAERDLRDINGADDVCARVATMRVVTARLVHEHVDALRRALDAVDASLDPLALHSARIEAKRLRYLLEPLSDFAPGANALIATLTTWQDALGELHDAHVLRKRIGTRRARRVARQARRARERSGAAARLTDAPLERAWESVTGRLETAREEVSMLLFDGRASGVLRDADAVADAFARRDSAVAARVRI